MELELIIARATHHSQRHDDAVNPTQLMAPQYRGTRPNPSRSPCRISLLELG